MLLFSILNSQGGEKSVTVVCVSLCGFERVLLDVRGQRKSVTIVSVAVSGERRSHCCMCVTVWVRESVVLWVYMWERKENYSGKRLFGCVYLLFIYYACWSFMRFFKQLSELEQVISWSEKSCTCYCYVRKGFISVVSRLFHACLTWVFWWVLQVRRKACCVRASDWRHGRGPQNGGEYKEKMF